MSSHRLSSTIRVVTYNVLSSCLCDPAHHVGCKPESLNPSSRFEKLGSILETETESGSVVCLQEISIDWAGKLHTFFARKNYHFITGLYGNKFNGYMGVAIAIPMSTFEIVETDITVVADTITLPKKARPPPPSCLSSCLTPIFKLFMTSKATEVDPWETSIWKRNMLVSVRLRHKSSVDSSTFVVSTYHMPCMFRVPQVMSIHCILSAQHVQSFSKGDPFIYCGDFNITPSSYHYRVLTGGVIEAGDPAEPPKLGDHPWNPKVEPMKSVYAIQYGKESEFTNFSQSKDQPPFMDTLDYIFLSDDRWTISNVQQLPSKEDALSRGPMPTETELSDHLLLAAELSLPF